MARASKPQPTKRSKAPQGTARLPPKAVRDHTLQAFRAAYTVRTDASYLSAKERAEENIPRDAPDRIPVRGIAPGHLMAARWCTMIDAVHEIGRRVYRREWTPSILADKPHFPYPDPTHGLVFRQVAWRHRPDDRSWRMAFGAYAVLCEALSEGLIHATAESLALAAVPPLEHGPEGRRVYVRERVPIDASDWRRDAVLMGDGLLASWWCITSGRVKGKSPNEPPWVVLIDRESLAKFLKDYAGVLTEEMASDAARQRGRKLEVPMELLEREVLPRWQRGEFGDKYAAVQAFIMAEHGVARSTARNYCGRLGICTGGANATPGRASKK